MGAARELKIILNMKQNKIQRIIKGVSPKKIKNKK